MKKIFSLLLKIVGAFLLLMFISAALLLFYDTHRYKVFHRSEHVPDLAHYVEHYGDPEEMFLVRVNQSQYYELIPPIGNYSVLVSGPPVFLYDKNGNLWDYTWNSGDVPFIKGGCCCVQFCPPPC